MQLIPGAKNWRAAEWSPRGLGNPCSAPEGKASRLPVSSDPSLREPLSLCALPFPPLIYTIQHPGRQSWRRGNWGQDRPRDSPPRSSEEPLQAPAAAPEPSPLPRLLLPRRLTLRAADGKQQPGAGHLLIGESLAALHLRPAPWKSLLLASQGGSLLQSSRVVDKHQSHGVNQMPGGAGGGSQN